MRPFMIRLGTLDQEGAEVEWQLRSFTNTARKRDVLLTGMPAGSCGLHNLTCLESGPSGIKGLRNWRHAEVKGAIGAAMRRVGGARMVPMPEPDLCTLWREKKDYSGVRVSSPPSSPSPPSCPPPHPLQPPLKWRWRILLAAQPSWAAFPPRPGRPHRSSWRAFQRRLSGMGGRRRTGTTSPGAERACSSGLRWGPCSCADLAAAGG
jgi:hypothetical protein